MLLVSSMIILEITAVITNQFIRSPKLSIDQFISTDIIYK